MYVVKAVPDLFGTAFFVRVADVRGVCSFKMSCMFCGQVFLDIDRKLVVSSSNKFYDNTFVDWMVPQGSCSVQFGVFDPNPYFTSHWNNCPKAEIPECLLHILNHNVFRGVYAVPS